jgi:sulfane dehydrogenase subunit SoxC
MSDALSRRTLIAGAASAVGAVALGSTPQGGSAPAAPPAPAVPDDATLVPGHPTSGRGARSAFEAPLRTPTGATAGASYTPLQDLHGTITPADLHFERHHAGVPVIDPARHRLVVHGLVTTPLEFTMDDLRRLPQVTRTHFIECSGNGRSAFKAPKAEMSPQQVAGMVSNSEWTGVTLATLFREVGARPDARWFLAEGGDACRMTRSVPTSKAYDDAIIAWAQNGEPLRPGQGYPLRLVLPGWEGNINVKWLRRLELGRAPWMTRWETAKYTDPIKGNVARIFSFENDAKSVITSPAFPLTLAARGWHRVSGLAWSGRGRITRVEVSADGGSSWSDAQLFGAEHTKACSRFEWMWEWSGQPAQLLSRATDQTGYVQPTLAALIDARGAGTDYHFNPIVGWNVAADGRITFEWKT